MGPVSLVGLRFLDPEESYFVADSISFFQVIWMKHQPIVATIGWWVEVGGLAVKSIE